jgi:hypothetical protein
MLSVASSVVADGWMTNWKGFGRKQSWPNQGTIAPFAWQGERKQQMS